MAVYVESEKNFGMLRRVEALIYDLACLMRPQHLEFFEMTNVRRQLCQIFNGCEDCDCVEKESGQLIKLFCDNAQLLFFRSSIGGAVEHCFWPFWSGQICWKLGLGA